MRDLTFTVYQNAQDVWGRPYVRPWDAWITRLAAHAHRGFPDDTGNLEALDYAKNGPALVLGEIPKGKSRKDKFVKSVHGLSIDIDNSSEEKILAALNKIKSFEYFLYTTHKHGSVLAKGLNRLRIILPLQTPIEPGDFNDAWVMLNYLVDGINDPKTKNIGRLNFLPSTFDPSVAKTFHNLGKWLDIKDLPYIHIENKEDSIFDSIKQTQAIEKIKYRLIALISSDPLKASGSSLARGEIFSQEGARHDTLLKLTMWIAQKNRTLTHTSIETLFAPSLYIMRALSPTAPTLKEAITSYDGAVKKLIEFDKQIQIEKLKKAQELQLTNVGSSEGSYSENEQKTIAQVHGWTTEELQKRWIVQKDGIAWFMLTTGEYAGPYTKDDIPLAASKYLARAPIRLIEITRSGFKYRPMGDIIRESGSLADKIISDMTTQKTTFDPVARTMNEAILPIRTGLEPKYNSEFDQWLKIAGGALYGKLVDWLSCLPDLKKLLCAIYFDGAPSSGKTLFAYGAAKIWTDGPPADIDSVLSDFNEELCRCPLVLGDEEIPKRWRSTVTTTLRSMLSTISRTLKRKYRPTSEVRGAIRLILAANNEFLLDNRDVSSSQDLEAIAQRFLYVPVSKKATDYLNTLSRSKKESWMKTGIAQHALWLAKHHKIENPGKRFWVEGDISQMHRLLMTGSKWNSLCCEWLVRYLMQPEAFDSKNTGFIKCEGDELLVNDQALIDGWELYIKTKQDPETAKIGAALRAISKTARRCQLRHEGRQIRYRAIDVDHLLAWSDRYNIGDREQILAWISSPVKSNDNIIDFNQPGKAWPEPGIDQIDQEEKENE